MESFWIQNEIYFLQIDDARCTTKTNHNSSPWAYCAYCALGEVTITATNLQSLKVVVWNQVKARHEWSIVLVSSGVRWWRNCSKCATPEVALSEENLGLVLGDALHPVAPLPGQFTGRLATLNTWLGGGIYTLNTAMLSDWSFVLYYINFFFFWNNLLVSQHWHFWGGILVVC